ncbi:unnamed protein product [Adineta steineri]|uniref:B box-type domain-containing protein n=1 Tax=Adineta steineri TaxID=433720 RepID=A0A814G524_9BILA|nr:unnamed protein product [Adineta steineri]
MASTVTRRSCTKCSKGVGVAICDGCQQSFCIKHFDEHRQELVQQLEHVGFEHDLLRRDLNQPNIDQHLLIRIDTWEQEAIAKIQAVAKIARNDLQQLLDRRKEAIKKSVSKLADDLQSCRESFDFTELDIKKWSQQLEELRKSFESSSSICIVEDDKSKSSISIIQVYDRQYLRSNNISIESSRRSSVTAVQRSNSVLAFNEKFDEIDGKAKTSEENLLVTCYSRTFLFPAIIYGINLYSTGIHRIKFRIENIKNSIFFGISTSSDKIRKADMFDTSLYGWWDIVRSVVASELHKSDDKKILETGDEVTLILDCNDQQIQLQHHRTNRLVQLYIDGEICPFPWRIVVKLRAEGDSVRILH